MQLRCPAAHGQTEVDAETHGDARTVTGPRVGPAVKVVEACPWASVTPELWPSVRSR
ncbi:MAG: hypothetical protein R2724_17195 [Bryobacterales bacterium]